MELWLIYLRLNKEYLMLAFFSAFCVGMVLALSTYFWNKEKKKKGFRKRIFTRKEKRIDKKMAAEYRKSRHFKDIYLEDQMEHFANKKY